MDIKALINSLKIVNRYKEFKIHGISEDNTLILMNFMFKLTSDGFEQYIRDYFAEVLHFDKVIVTGGIQDGGIDVKGRKNGRYVAIQCKQFATAHVTNKDVLEFIEQTKEAKKRLGETLSLFFITTNWINPQAWAKGKNNGIYMGCYREILKMNKKLDINDFIQKYKNNQKLITGINVNKVLDIYYNRKLWGRWLGDIMYFIDRYLSPKSNPYNIDYETVERYFPEKEADQKLL